MCGIAGYYGFEGKELIPQFSKGLFHRGPDGEGVFIDTNVGLLNRRLAIIDIHGGAQPLYNEDHTIVTVYNGEIYNYRELRQELEKTGHAFKTNSDTEIIVHSFEQWGVAGFSRFDGMFAIALYDKKKRSLFLARDQFGIKPLYYLIHHNRVIFSSEIKPLLCAGLIRAEVNERVLYRYLQYRVHDDREDTFFKGISRLMPGETKELNMINGKLHVKNDKLTIQKTKNSTQPFDQLLNEAIKKRLISEVQVGTCLSGGLDSSTIVAIVNNLIDEKKSEARSVGKKQNTFSAVFPEYSNNEERYVDALLKQYQSISSHKIKPTSKQFINEITDFVRTQEEPTISTGPYAQYCVMREAKKKITVLLDGQGVDEMMAGYIPYYVVFLNELLKRRQFFRICKEILASFDVFLPLIIQKIKEKIGILRTVSMQSLLSRSFIRSNKNERFAVINDDLQKRLQEDIFKNSLQALLRYEDRNSMRFSIEGRVPFLDNDIYVFISSLPSDMIIRNGWNKFVLRESIQNRVPEMIRKRRNKIGFTTPEYAWFHEQKDWVMSIFRSESFTSRKYFNQKAVVKAFNDFINKKNSDTLVFWRILNTELWMREFIDTNT